MQKIVELIKRMAARDTAFSYLLLFMLKLCRHWFCEALVTIIEIAIGIMTAFTYFGVLLWVVCALLVILLIGSGLCKAYDLSVKADREDEVAILREENKLLLKAKNSANVLNGAAAKNIYRMARTIKHKGWVSPLNEMRNVYGFQVMAFAVCEEIYNLLQAKFGLNGHWVPFAVRSNKSPAGEASHPRRIVILVSKLVDVVFPAKKGLEIFGVLIFRKRLTLYAYFPETPCLRQLFYIR